GAMGRLGMAESGDAFLGLGADRRFGAAQCRVGRALAHTNRCTGLAFELGARGGDPGQRTVARLFDLGDVERGLDAGVATQLHRVLVAETEGELADEEGQHRNEEEQPERADVADATPGEVLQGEVARTRKQWPQGARRARVPVEHAVEDVADQAGEVAYQALPRPAAGWAMLAPEFGAAGGAGGPGGGWGGCRRQLGGCAPQRVGSGAPACRTRHSIPVQRPENRSLPLLQPPPRGQRPRPGTPGRQAAARSMAATGMRG